MIDAAVLVLILTVVVIAMTLTNLCVGCMMLKAYSEILKIRELTKNGDRKKDPHQCEERSQLGDRCKLPPHGDRWHHGENGTSWG